MIAIRKEDKKLYEVLSSNEKFIEIVHANCAINFHKKELYTLYFNESEVQQRIEAAVKEHDNKLNNLLQHVPVADELSPCGKVSELLVMYDILEAEKNELALVKEELSDRITELEAAQQPVEVSAELAEAIKWFKSIHINTWHYKIFEIYYSNYSHNQKFIRTIKNQPAYFLVNIIKRGYTVKPDPLRTRIAAILGSDHEQLDAVVAAAREVEAE